MVEVDKFIERGYPLMIIEDIKRYDWDKKEVK